ncbi:hypothetical protein HWV62_10034 [Athelia sp. TMB]|nr:hypothetical protein HWV62_11912 [Athelia sp. TMB]KAF7975281.1 hypothetical protein HWV62_10034 [Athelia sp. TMB]
MPATIVRRRAPPEDPPLPHKIRRFTDSLFFELPPELKTEILRYLSDEDVYTICLISRKLHFLALPVFISRQNGQLIHRSLYLYKPPFKLLRAARVALYVTELASFSLTTYAPHVPIVETLHELRHMVKMMKYVGVITLDVEIKGGAAEPLGRLLGTLVGKACTSLTVRRWDLDAHTVASEEEPEPIPPLTTLQSLDMASCSLSYLPIRDWLVASINQSNIHSLSLYKVECAPWTGGEALRALTLPSLAKLSITELPGLQWVDIAAFLVRHPKIMSLYLKCDAAIPAEAPQLPHNALPSLSTLRSSPLYIQHFLRSPTSLRVLKHVEVDSHLPRVTGDFVVDFADVEDTLVLLSRHPTITSIGLPLLLNGMANEWLMNGSSPGKDGGRRDVERLATHVKTVKICPTITLTSATTFALLPRWLALMPAIQHVDLTVVWGLDTTQKTTFLAELAAVCPTAETVQIGLERWSLDKFR